MSSIIEGGEIRTTDDRPSDKEYEHADLVVIDELLATLRRHADELTPGSREVPSGLTTEQRAILAGEAPRWFARLLRERSARRSIDAAEHRDALRGLFSKAAENAVCEQRIAAYLEALIAVRF